MPSKRGIILGYKDRLKTDFETEQQRLGHRI